MQKVEEQARADHSAVHGLAAPGSRDADLLRALCAATGGSFLQAGAVEEIPDLIQEIYHGLLNRYEVSYRVAAGSESPRVKVQVYCDQGYGEGEALLLAKPA